MADRNDLDAVGALAQRYTAAIGPGGDKAWLAGQLARRVPGLVAEVRELRAQLEEYGGADDPRHIIEFRTDGWTIKHPLSCRIGDLFGCRVNLSAEDLEGPPVPPGRYEAAVSDIDGQLLIGDRVEPTAAAVSDG